LDGEREIREMEEGKRILCFHSICLSSHKQDIYKILALEEGEKYIKVNPDVGKIE
jgi:hypothetical protein